MFISQEEYEGGIQIPTWGMNRGVCELIFKISSSSVYDPETINGGTTCRFILINREQQIMSSLNKIAGL